ncbi:MAG: thermonuclease family protein [Parvibaculum sp.]|uniref:thermonuclease family protein n=1 Tax=Parvibaculum sp. TaxID=2024848 RepID=UPI0032EC3F4E
MSSAAAALRRRPASRCLAIAAWFSVLLLPMLSPATGRAAECDLETGEEGLQVEDVIDGDTLLLDDGREVRLTGIQAPKLPLGRAGFEPWPKAEEARQALAAFLASKTITLKYGGARIDRHGRILAHVFAGQGQEALWLQREMLRAGLARVYTFPDNRACASELLEAERSARRAGLEIWQDPFYDIRDASNEALLGERVGRFELVEGEISSAALVRGRIYLNFGDDYREDFTVTVNDKNARLFLEHEPWSSLLSTDDEAASVLSGQRIRVRGWVDRYNGPEISATHPEEIELLERNN